MHGIRGGFFVLEREVVYVVEREVVRDDPPPQPAPAPPPPPRELYVIGSTYSSIPSGCMKMINDGASYYHCDGDWFRAVLTSSRVRYLAVRMP